MVQPLIREVHFCHRRPVLVVLAMAMPLLSVGVGVVLTCFDCSYRTALYWEKKKKNFLYHVEMMPDPLPIQFSSDR